MTTLAQRALLVATAAALAAACNAITGASGYSDVNCTSSGLDSCAEACTEQGGAWNAATSACNCSDGTPPCGGFGGLCCAALGLVCAADSTGRPQCEPCPTGEPQCGSFCCAGTQCLNAKASVCGVEFGKAGQSCGAGLVCPIPMLDGTTAGADCCESIALPGGAFPMGRSATGTDRCPANDVAAGACQVDELPEETVTLSPYHLDRFEVTVGRFRSFAGSWDYKGLPPAAGPNINIGLSGWDSGWNASLPATITDLEKDLTCMTNPYGATPSLATWTHAAGTHENLPINCVTWYEALAFCMWDGGRLPTEAEWEFAAANGAANDLYPWGEKAPSPTLAVYDCASDALPCSRPPSLPAAVGSLAGGANRAGHRDLAGNVLEWTRDSIAPYPMEASTDYAFLTSDSYGFPVARGGQFTNAADKLRAAARTSSAAGAPSPAIGFRCARNN